VIALNLNVKDETIVQRIASRLTCKQCGNIQSTSLNSEACTKCQGELFQRADDKPEVVQERLRVYNEQTEPLIDFYQHRGVLIDINGENAPEKVFQDLMQAYQKKN